MGNMPLVMEAKPITLSTWGISLRAFSISACSLIVMPSVISKEKAPFPKS